MNWKTNCYDRDLAERTRKTLAGRRGVAEKEMFGGIAFLLRGRMFCGITDDTLMARIGPDRYEGALDKAHVRPMDFTGESPVRRASGSARPASPPTQRAGRQR